MNKHIMARINLFFNGSMQVNNVCRDCHPVLQLHLTQTEQYFIFAYNKKQN